jgi:uncharacterized membrane protein YbaN (DUF454 family)
MIRVSRKKEKMGRFLRISLGTISILLGIPGLVLPILQGWLFLALGALLLSIDIPWFNRMVVWIENRVPVTKKPLERIRNFLRKTDHH